MTEPVGTRIGRDAWAPGGFAPVPGDAIRFGRLAEPRPPAGTVEAIYLCAEQDGGHTVRWSWIVLTDGRLLEIALRGCALYDPPTVLPRGSGRFLDLVAQDGALVRFEERVRAGTWEQRPVRLSLGGRRWRVTSTGTVAAHRVGLEPGSGWGQLGRGPDQDVYFTFVALDDPDALGLGLWAADICLAFGRRLGATPGDAALSLAESGD